MSLKATLSTAGAISGLLVPFALLLGYIESGDANASENSARNLRKHVEVYHTQVDTALLNRLSRLETKVDTFYVKQAENRVLLGALDTRTQIILQKILGANLHGNPSKGEQ